MSKNFHSKVTEMKQHKNSFSEVRAPFASPNQEPGRPTNISTEAGRRTPAARLYSIRCRPPLKRLVPHPVPELAVLSCLMASARSSLCSAWLTLTQPLSLSYKITSQADSPDFLIPARALTQAAGASLSPHTLLTCDYLIMIIEYFLLSRQ